MLGIFESHPVQYRAPVYRELERLRPGSFHVFYATDLSVRGKRDPGFGASVAWDEPLLDGYPNTVLGLESPVTGSGFLSLRGTRLRRLVKEKGLSAVLLTQFNYAFDLSVLIQSCLFGIPVWIRQETQDEAFLRSGWKRHARSLLYRFLYTGVSHAFAIGRLNREHLQRHGIPGSRISMARYCATDRFAGQASSGIVCMGRERRAALGIACEELVIGFFGKLIPKKNPLLLAEAALLLDRPVRLLFVGSGELEAELRRAATRLGERGIRTTFAGFVNQSVIATYYAATDILVLPSRRMGETWGLVVNEALQAGCSVALSDAVGCGAEFGELRHCRVFPDNDAAALAKALSALADNPPPDRIWARDFMREYSTEAAAAAMATVIDGAQSGWDPQT
jgi:glycosyltransferase involved in cell wall biosynthesis